MRIGIGVTTFNRPECLETFLQQLKQNQPYNHYELHIAQNIPNIAKAKNECLWALRNCDHIFLFDDDTFVIAPNWDLPFIHSGYGHLLYMNDNHLPAQRLEDVTRYRDCSGCFMYMTKQVFNEIGYFNSEYDQYGFEHMGYSDRIRRLLKDWGFLCLNTTSKFIYSLDLQGLSQSPVKIHHEPCLSSEKIKVSKGKNFEIYQQELNNDKLYYEYN